MGDARRRPYRPTSYVLLPVLILIAAFWGWAFWKWPMRMFSLLPFALPFYLVRTSIGPLPTTMLELIILATVIAWFIKFGWKGVREIKSAAPNWLLPTGLWLLAGFIGIFVAQNHIAALGLYRAYFVEPLLIFFIGLDLYRGDAKKEDAKRSEGTACRAPTILSILLIILGLYAIIQYLTGWGIPAPWDAVIGRRAVGPFPYPNALSLFVTPIAALLFADFLKQISKRDNSKNRATQGVAPTISLLGFLFGLISIALAESNGGMIALAAAMFVASMFYKRARIIAISLLIAIVIGIGAVSPLRQKVVSLVSFKQWSGMVRTVMWKESFAMLKDHPVFGAGLGGYPDAIKPYHKATWMEIFQYPHDIVLNLWSETGLLGIVAFGWILITWQKAEGRRQKGIPPAFCLLPSAIAVLTAILIQGLVDVPYFKNDLAVMFWLLILITTQNLEFGI